MAAGDIGQKSEGNCAKEVSVGRMVSSSAYSAAERSALQVLTKHYVTDDTQQRQRSWIACKADRHWNQHHSGGREEGKHG